AGARGAADPAGRLQLLEPRGEDVARDPVEPRGELAVAPGSDQQVADDQECPALADQFERLRDAAVLPVVARGHRPQTCWFVRASGAGTAALASIQPNSRMLPS